MWKKKQYNTCSYKKLKKININLELGESEYIFGLRNQTKNKLMRVSGALIYISNSILKIFGSIKECERAKRYIKIILSQRKGTVRLIYEDCHKNDLTLIHIPNDCFGFLRGKENNMLRKIEKKWDTLLFFSRYENSKNESLAIFGRKHARRETELLVISLVENKHPFYYFKFNNILNPKHYLKFREVDYNCGIDWLFIKNKIKDKIFLQYKGNNFKKIQKASGCKINYISNWASIYGNQKERERGLRLNEN